MRLIEKGTEPKALTEYRTAGGTYAEFSAANGKDEVKQQLLAEQNDFCAYCTSSIRLTEMKLEHWHPQSAPTPPDRSLDYTNMLGCCTGILYSGTIRHCDTSKGSTPITINPLLSHHVNQLRYGKGTGEITSDNPVLNGDINDSNKLNLNCQPFKTRRKKVFRVFSSRLNKGKQEGKPINVAKELKQFLANRDPFDDIIIEYLQRRLASGK